MSNVNGVFVYDESMSFNENFSVWFDMNTYERSVYGEEPYSKEEGFAVFSGIFEVNNTNS